MKLNKISNTPPLAAIIVLLGTALAASAADWKVVDVPSLTNAFKQAAANDSICIVAGTYELNGSAMGTATYLTTTAAKPLKILGLGAKPEDTVLKGGGYDGGHRILSIYATEGVVVSNLTFTGGAITNNGTGGALICTLTANGQRAQIVKCRFVGNICYGASYTDTFNSGGGAIGISVPGSGNPVKTAMDISDCWFESNRNELMNKQAEGGALVATYSTVSDCTFTNNYCANNGGAVVNGDHYRNRFLYNHANGQYTPTSMGGGAARRTKNKLVFNDCYFEGNTTLTAYNHGGVIYYADACSNCVFYANGAKSNGMIESCPIIYKCHFTNNVVATYLSGSADYAYCTVFSNKVNGGQIFNGAKSLRNCLIVSNNCGSVKGMVQNTKLYNCTFVGNYFTSGNTAESVVNYQCVAVNCLFYGNNVKGGNYDIALYDDITVPVLSNCQWGAQFYVNNRSKYEDRLSEAYLIKESPFAPTADNPYMIGKKSAARDAGYLDDNVRALVGDKDLAGKCRISIDKIDLGCYEYQAPGMLLLVR